jgi:hypothetical protein
MAGIVIKLYPSIQSGQVLADVDMPGIDNRLIGRRISAKVEVGMRKALLVPTGYVTNRFGIDYVTILAKGGNATSVSVQTAPSAEAGMIELLSGANAGDRLIGDSGK